MFFSKICNYYIFERQKLDIHKASSQEISENYIAIPNGFNFYAFLFGIFWFAYKKLYIQAFVILALGFVVSFLYSSEFISHPISLALNLLINIHFALESNLMLKNHHAKNNNLIAIVLATSVEDAKEKIINLLLQEKTDIHNHSKPIIKEESLAKDTIDHSSK